LPWGSRPEDLRTAAVEHRLERRLRVYLAPKVLIVDEFGVWPYDRAAATALFQLIAARYERGSIILTSNKSFGDWGEVLGDPVIATAILSVGLWSKMLRPAPRMRANAPRARRPTPNGNRCPKPVTSSWPTSRSRPSTNS
jgi:hypothetical protein